MLLRDAVKGLFEETIQHEIVRSLLEIWIPVELWYEACHAIMIQSPYQPFLHENKLTLREFKACLSRHTSYRGIIESFRREDNETGIFKVTVGRDIYLYITQQKITHLPAQPAVNQTFYAQAENAARNFQRSLRHFGRKLDIKYLDPEPSRNVRRKIDTQQETEESEVEGGVQGHDHELMVEAPAPAAAAEVHAVYWESPEAIKLFGAQPGDENAWVTVNKRIEILQNVNQDLNGYKLVIEGGDPHNECTETTGAHSGDGVRKVP